jgi:hypothetical protein
LAIHSRNESVQMSSKVFEIEQLMAEMFFLLFSPSPMGFSSPVFGPTWYVTHPTLADRTRWGAVFESVDGRDSNKEHGQNTDKLERAALSGGPNFMISLVAGGGFEPPTFGL